MMQEHSSSPLSCDLCVAAQFSALLDRYKNRKRLSINVINPTSLASYENFAAADVGLIIQAPTSISLSTAQTLMETLSTTELENLAAQRYAPSYLLSAFIDAVSHVEFTDENDKNSFFKTLVSQQASLLFAGTSHHLVLESARTIQDLLHGIKVTPFLYKIHAADNDPTSRFESADFISPAYREQRLSTFIPLAAIHDIQPISQEQRGSYRKEAQRILGNSTTGAFMPLSRIIITGGEVLVLENEQTLTRRTTMIWKP